MWFIPAVLTILAWGAADLFYKKGNAITDRYSAVKTTIMVGMVMGLHVLLYYVLYQDIHYDWQNLWLYLPVSSMYILSMAVGYFGLRYIEVSVSSPISNSSGAVTAMLGLILLGNSVNGLQFSAVIMILVGILLLSIFEKQSDEAELTARGTVIERKYRISAIAIIFPIIYMLIDGVGTFLDSYYLEFKQLMSEDQANMSYELTFFIVAVVLWLYLKLVKRETGALVVNVKEKDKFFAAAFETAGQFFYVGAIANEQALIVAPLISAYAIVSVLLGRIFLKEKLTWKQYAVIIMILVGIVILGFYDG